MGRASTKENKNIYQITRENLDLSREKASELLETIPPERIEKIENEKSMPHPDEVLTMSKGYKKPSLCNYYCSNQCPIGKEYVPQIEVKELSAIVLETLQLWAEKMLANDVIDAEEYKKRKKNKE
ncbi:MAG: XRE family transcriptional regulator [Lachnospiraceae bacterium]|nr:XRE family transcriptional regulator [Lachnospiraceae bacterium]